MPRPMQLRTVGACALALCLALVPAAGASAAGFKATLRVVGAGNRVLAEKHVRTHDVKVKTSPRATCLGAGTGGSGKRAALRGNTALGLLADAARTTRRLAPLSLTDHFSFGLGLCGVGGSFAKGNSSWYLKINHEVAAVGGEKARIRPGDEVLWDLAPTYPYPDELAVRAPRHVNAGVPFAVRVFAYDEKGRRKPVKGAAVTGAHGRTDARGRAMVTLRRPTRLRARFGKDITSAPAAVCLAGRCPGR